MGQVTSVLGSVAPALNSVTRAVNAIDQVGSLFGGGQSDGRARAQQDLRQAQAQALQQLEAKQSADFRDREEQASLDRDRIVADAQASEDRRRAALRRAVSRQRAQFASQGIGGTGGSTDAVLLGLFEESDDERQERERIDSIRNRALDQDLSSRQRLNVLQRSQLLERQRLERATSRF